MLVMLAFIPRFLPQALLNEEIPQFAMLIFGMTPGY